MDRLYIKNLKIEKVRHLKDVEIPVSEERMKHLVFTGRNGSGKTSLLEAMSVYLNSISTSNTILDAPKYIENRERMIRTAKKNGDSENEIKKHEDFLAQQRKRLVDAKGGIDIEFNYPLDGIYAAFEKGEFVLAYYKAERIFRAIEPRHVEKVELKKVYSIKEEPSKDFIKYLVDLKVTQALALTSQKMDKANDIQNWFNHFGRMLKQIFQNDSVELVFDEESFKFTIHEDGKEPFDFNSLSSGYAAILNIVVDILIRMEKQTQKRFNFDMPGIILIDEIETHLHLELQKNVLDLLTSIFPNVQFVISTHSPFILTSLENVVIYDLEKKLLVQNGLSDISYSGVVEGYFGAEELSNTLKKKFQKYKELTKKEMLTDEDFNEIARLEVYLKEIPDYLNLSIATDFQRLKLEFEQREDL